MDHLIDFGEGMTPTSVAPQIITAASFPLLGELTRPSSRHHHLAEEHVFVYTNFTNREEAVAIEPPGGGEGGSAECRQPRGLSIHARFLGLDLYIWHVS